MMTPVIVVTPFSVQVQSLSFGVSFVEGMPIELKTSQDMWADSPYLFHFALVVRYQQSVLVSPISVKIFVVIPARQHPVALSPSYGNVAYLGPGAFSVAAVRPGSFL